jgi:deoxyribonuclease V
MIAALDVQYDETTSRAVAAAVVFSNWDDATPAAEYTAVVDRIQPYTPGEFFRRELPCLLAVLNRIAEPITTLVIDGYVQLAAKPGLGQHLYDHLSGRFPIIGVAKTPFHNAPTTELFRGSSKLPLYVTSVGMDPTTAASHIRHMHGPHRISTLLKRVDRIARNGRTADPSTSSPS